MTYIYIGSPYSHLDPKVRQARYFNVMDYVDWLLKNTSHTPYSPIMHFHEFVKRHNHPGDALYWERHNLAMLAGASQLHVLNIPGAANSRGLAREIAQADATRTGLWLADPDRDGHGHMFHFDPSAGREDESEFMGGFNLVQTNIQELAQVLR